MLSLSDHQNGCLCVCRCMTLLKTLEKSRTTIYTPVCTGEFRKAHVYGGEKRPKKSFPEFSGH